MRARISCHEPDVLAGVTSLLGELDATADFGDPQFSAAQDEAEVSAARGPNTPWWPHPRVDLTSVEFVTVDPPGAQDLDQALHLEQSSAGWVVQYAIADVAAFVQPGGAVDAEAWARGETWYGPEFKRRLHPAAISEGAASLLAGQKRPALVWRIRLTSALDVASIELDRAWVRSTAQLDYAQVERSIDDGSAANLSPSLALLAQLGPGLVRQAGERGAVSLPLPDQEVSRGEDGFELAYRAPLPVEEWNAQISLLTGRCAAELMRRGGLGIVRTLPPAAAEDLERLRRVARSVGVSWPGGLGYPEFIASLDSTQPAHAAVAVAATRTLRGSGYHVIEGGAEVPWHHAIAAAYAHVTAPLRRLVDRYGLECCLAHAHGVEVPQWVQEKLPLLPDAVKATSARASTFERAILDLMEASLLAERVGEVFAGTILSTRPDDASRGTVMVKSPAVEAPVDAEPALPLGEEVQVRLVEADPQTRTVRFALVEPPRAGTA